MENEKEQETKYVKLPSNFKIKHETEKGILIVDDCIDDGEWFPRAYVKIDGESIEVADWLVSKSYLLKYLLSDYYICCEV